MTLDYFAKFQLSIVIIYSDSEKLKIKKEKVNSQM